MLHEETGVALRYIQVSAGAYHTVAIDEHENIRTFGSGRRGRLGHPAIGAEEEGRNNGSEESSSNSEGGGGGGGGGSSGLNSGNSRRMYYNMSRPQLVLAMKDLGCGGILLQSNDSQWAFLRHSLSQKEEGNNEGGEEGVAMKFGSNLGAMAKAVQMVACGRSHTLALTRGGAIWAWGDNEQGQCGTALTGGDKDGGVHPKGTGKKKKQTREEMLEQKQQQDLQNKWFPHARSSAGSAGGSHYVQPIRLPDVYGGASVVAVAAGSWHSMCLTNRGIVSKVYVWGRAVEGQLGNGTEGTHVGKGSKRRASNAWSASVVPSLSGLHIRR